MATPDYLQQVIVSGRRHGAGRANAVRRGVFQRPSVTSLVWASLDVLTATVAAVMAIRLRIRAPGHQVFSLLPSILSQDLAAVSGVVLRGAGPDHAIFRPVRSHPEPQRPA